MRIACINYEPVSSYYTHGWSRERLGRYYNPDNIATEVCIFSNGDKNWKISSSVNVIGYNSYFELEKKCESYKPDVIRCYEAFHPNCDYALLLALKMGIPSYLSLHDASVVYPSWIKYYTIITAYTETLVNRASKELKRNVELQLNGIDSKIFKPLSCPQVDPRVQNCKHRIFTIGRDTKPGMPSKNIDTVMRATDLLSKKVGSLAHVITGPGTERIGYDGIHLGTGSLTETKIADYLNWSQCFLQVQTVSDVGMAATEALMVGRPVILTGGVDGNAQYHIDTYNGILVPIERVLDAQLIADLIMNCLNKKYDYKTIRENAILVYDEEILRKSEAERYNRLFKSSNVTIISKLKRNNIMKKIMKDNTTLSKHYEKGQHISTIAQYLPPSIKNKIKSFRKGAKNNAKR